MIIGTNSNTFIGCGLYIESLLSFSHPEPDNQGHEILCVRSTPGLNNREKS